MLVAGPSYGLSGRPLTLCDSATSVAKSKSSLSSSSNSSKYSLIKSFAEHLNRGTELIKKILPTKKLSPNSTLQILSPGKIHRSEDTPESDSGDSLQTEISHFEPICKMPPTPKQEAKLLPGGGSSSSLKHPKPKPYRCNNSNKFKPLKAAKKLQRSHSSAFLMYSCLLQNVKIDNTASPGESTTTVVSSQEEKRDVILKPAAIITTTTTTTAPDTSPQKLKRRKSSIMTSSTESLQAAPQHSIATRRNKRPRIEAKMMDEEATLKHNEDNQNNNNKIYNLRQKNIQINYVVNKGPVSTTRRSSRLQKIKA